MRHIPKSGLTAFEELLNCALVIMNAGDVKREYYVSKGLELAHAGWKTINVNLFRFSDTLTRLGNNQVKGAGYASLKHAIFESLELISHEINHLTYFEEPGTHSHHSDETLDDGFAQRQRRTLDRLVRFLDISVGQDGHVSFSVLPGYKEFPILWDRRMRDPVTMSKEYNGLSDTPAVPAQDGIVPANYPDARLMAPLESTKISEFINGPVASRIGSGDIYEIRYDRNRLLEYAIHAGLPRDVSPEAILNEYTNALKIRAKNPDCIKLIPTEGKSPSGRFLVSVTRFEKDGGSRAAGESNIDVSEDLNGQILDMVSIMNLLLSAVQLPEDIPGSDEAEYVDVIASIKAAYRNLTGRTYLPETWFTF
jgi:hypothetical protein